MKKIDTSSITPIAGMPLKSGGLDHLQSAYQEGIQQMAIPIIGIPYTTFDYFIMQGCRNTGSGSNYIISAGSIYHNNEWFLVDAATFTAPMGQTAVGTITTTFFTSANADPTTFTDGVPHNVNVIRKIVFAAGVSGSGDIDFNNLKPVGMNNFIEIGDPGAPVFQNSWGFAPGILFAFKKDHQKQIAYIKALIGKSSWNGSTSTVCTLPSGFTPISLFASGYTAVYQSVGGAVPELETVEIFITAGRDFQVRIKGAPYVASDVFLSFDFYYHTQVV
jgi:hypothetical protein